MKEKTGFGIVLKRDGFEIVFFRAINPQIQAKSHKNPKKARTLKNTFTHFKETDLKRDV